MGRNLVEGGREVAAALAVELREGGLVELQGEDQGCCVILPAKWRAGPEWPGRNGQDRRRCSARALPATRPACATAPTWSISAGTDGSSDRRHQPGAAAIPGEPARRLAAVALAPADRGPHGEGGLPGPARLPRRGAGEAERLRRPPRRARPRPRPVAGPPPRRAPRPLARRAGLDRPRRAVAGGARRRAAALPAHRHPLEPGGLPPRLREIMRALGAVPPPDLASRPFHDHDGVRDLGGKLDPPRRETMRVYEMQRDAVRIFANRWSRATRRAAPPPTSMSAPTWSSATTARPPIRAR